MAGLPVAWVNASSVAAPTGGQGADAALEVVLGYLDAHVVTDACLRMPLSRSDVGPDGTVTDVDARWRLTSAMTALSVRASSVP